MDWPRILPHSTSQPFCLVAAFLALNTANFSAPKSPTMPQNESLAQAAKTQQMKIGTAVQSGLLKDNTYRSVVANEFNLVEPENELKFDTLQPEEGKFNFVPADEIYDFAKQHNMDMRGHVLIWHSQIPRWVTSKERSADEMAKIAQSHITAVLNHYKGKIQEWDCVNEVVSDKDGEFRHSPWYDKPGIGFAGKGPEFVEQCFRWAHEVDPKVRLFYNDYSIETLGAKSDTVYEMAKTMVANKAPIHGVGFQAHLWLGFDSPENWESMRKNIDRFQKLGLEVQLTEVDVRMESDSAENLAKQAALLSNLMAVCRDKGIKTVQFWGVTDKHSWIPQVFKGFDHALLFDKEYKKKPAYRAVMDVLLKTEAVE